jgi:Domain of unknown function (DUF4170)
MDGFSRHGPYWVVGGEYTGTDFRILAPGARLERHGPYTNRRDAYEVWQDLSWRQVDNCHVRYRIVECAEAPAA